MTRYLHTSPQGKVLRGAQSTIARFERFKETLPALAAALDRAHSEVDPFRDYRVYLALLKEFVDIEQQAAAL